MFMGHFQLEIFARNKFIDKLTSIMYNVPPKLHFHTKLRESCMYKMQQTLLCCQRCFNCDMFFFCLYTVLLHYYISVRVYEINPFFFFSFVS